MLVLLLVNTVGGRFKRMLGNVREGGKEGREVGVTRPQTVLSNRIFIYKNM